MQNILHHCLWQSACSSTCQRSTIKGGEIATPFLCYATGHLSFEMSCSFKDQDEMYTWCHGRYLSSLSLAVALQTANPDSPALTPDHRLSLEFVPEDPDEFTMEDGPLVPDELPSAGETDMNATSDCETTLFLVFYVLLKSPKNSVTQILEFKSCPPVSAHPS